MLSHNAYTTPQYLANALGAWYYAFVRNHALQWAKDYERGQTPETMYDCPDDFTAYILGEFGKLILANYNDYVASCARAVSDAESELQRARSARMTFVAEMRVSLPSFPDYD